MNSTSFSLKIFARFIPVLFIMGIIFYLSNQPGDSYDLPEILGVDKLLHIIAYASLAAALLYGLEPLPGSSFRVVPAIVIVLFCILFGIGNEYHQSFIPLRTVSAWDVAADTVGALLVVLLWFCWSRSVRHNNSP